MSKNENILNRVSTMSSEQIMESLTNQELNQLCTIILDSETVLPNNDGGYYKGPTIYFVFIDGDKFIAVDNRTNDCWIEQFNNKESALSWATDSEGDHK
jgi:hypothetical protein